MILSTFAHSMFHCFTSTFRHGVFFCIKCVVGSIIGVIIRYGLDAQKDWNILDCSLNKSETSDYLPSTLLIRFNNSYYEYTNGRKVQKEYAAQPQFEDKVNAISVVLYLDTHMMCD